MEVISPRALGPDVQELKEAVCDAIVNLTTDRVSGNGPEGEIVYARLPRRAFFAGVLLPAVDASGEDETSDIHISTMGIDLHIAADAHGEGHLQPSFATYIRVLPTWEELQERRLGLDPNFRLSPTLEQQIKTDIAAERRRRFIEEGLNRPDPKDMPVGERQARRARRLAIRAEAARLAYGQHGITLEPEDVVKALKVSMSAEGLSPAEQVRSVIPPGEGDKDDNTPPGEGEATGDLLEVSVLRQGGRVIPAQLLRPTDIPMKWRRLPVQLPVFTWDLSLSATELAAKAASYSGELRKAADAFVLAWINSPEGREQCWRDQPIRPADVANREAWNAFLTNVRDTAPDPNLIAPDVSGINVGVDKLPTYTDPTLASLRVTLENGNRKALPPQERERTETLFQVHLSLAIPQHAHRFLTLDRVEPSYRFRDHMAYPAMGLNCGVTSTDTGQRKVLATTWAPRFVQPRIIARASDMPYQFAALADDALDVSVLMSLPRQYRDWINEAEPRLRTDVRIGLSTQDADRESRRLEADLAGQRKEARYIERGVELLVEAQKAARQLETTRAPEERKRLLPLTYPWRAWLYMNRTFLRREKGDAERGWRLFQIAFVLAHIPTLVSRMPEFRDWHDPELDEASASLLYFPTGGGKSEAFYGTLIYAMFLDRLRGKDRGITAMIRYPLRLLTLQQAQRLLRLLVHAEMIRRDDKVGNWPFEIGFWVGKSNTPNRFNKVPAQVPSDDDTDHPDDSTLLPASSSTSPEALVYEETWLAYNKIPKCPVCGDPTGLRRLLSEDDTAKRLAIYCFNTRCDWNKGAPRRPLPFLLTDDTIYQRAPSVVLGTVDKMAMLGQNTDTVAQLLGMFGLARWIGPTGHLNSPRGDELTAGPVASGYQPVSPAYQAGNTVFHDPFPALIIQDEAHLLDESLGTFSGLFETLLDQTLRRIAEIAGDELQIARAWDGKAWGSPRTPKVIAATATVSDPERQLEVLYQRSPLRFPYPGPDIYQSFFSRPAPAPEKSPERLALQASLPQWQSPEAVAPWMRLYVSLMTNGATHTMTTVAVLSAFHLVITQLWRGLNDPTREAATIARIRAAISTGRDGDWRRAALDRTVAGGRQSNLMALIDLHRIALAYVTNKKGGDQIMDALHLQVAKDHLAANSEIGSFDSRLISGGIDMQTIQQIMADAERELPSGVEYPGIDKQMRSVVATSAISHGVDVDRFNSMFFAGLPSDVAEYIQASSRVGRTHVGFVMLVPTPQSRRDRYVVETHDIFHRFLERMIAPPAVQRWAANAIRRVTASVIQSWAMVKEAEAFNKEADDRKHIVRRHDIVRYLNNLAVRDSLALRNELVTYMLDAIGYEGRGAKVVGKPVYQEVYRDLTDREIAAFVKHIETFASDIRLAEYWKESGVLQQPMTSLRDVDEAGLIVPCTFDPRGTGGRLRVSQDALVTVMKAIRSQRGNAAETDGESEREESAP